MILGIIFFIKINILEKNIHLLTHLWSGYPIFSSLSNWVWPIAHMAYWPAKDYPYHFELIGIFLNWVSLTLLVGSSFLAVNINAFLFWSCSLALSLFYAVYRIWYFTSCFIFGVAFNDFFFFFILRNAFKDLGF